jgi:hypothetical protein
MSSPLVQMIGYIGLVSYCILIVLVFVGQRLLDSKNEKHAKIGYFLVASLGGPRAARDAQEMLDQRRSAC